MPSFSQFDETSLSSFGDHLITSEPGHDAIELRAIDGHLPRHPIDHRVDRPTSIGVELVRFRKQWECARDPPAHL